MALKHPNGKRSIGSVLFRSHLGKEENLTFVVGGEAEHVVVVLVFVSQAVVANPRHRVLASAGFSGCGDGILDRSVTQPAGVAPVHPFPPRVIQLVEGRHDGILVTTSSLGVVEVEVVATEAREVGEDDACRGAGTEAQQDVTDEVRPGI